MTPKSKKALIVIVSLLAIGGGVGYFLWKRKKDKDAEAEAKVKADAEAAAAAAASQSGSTSESGSTSGSTTTSGSTSGGGSTSGSTTGYSFPFKTEAEGNAFRKWVNDKYPSYAKQIKLDVTGKLNAYVQTAWDKYGSEYNKALGKSGLSKGQLLYPKYAFDTAYSYPSKEKKYQIGRVRRNGAKAVAKFVRDSNTKGWIVADAVVEDYKGKLSLKKGIFLDGKSYTTVAP